MAQLATPAQALDVDQLRATAEKAAQRFKAPGVQVVIVRSGEVLFAGGFGYRDVAQGLGITERTLFAHGSTGKSYTALLIGTLVDDGLLTWDTKVADLLPDFRLSDPIVTRQVSVRDILSHRWGFPRHEFSHLAYPADTRDEMVRRLRHLDLSKELREQFQYSNFGYMLAGHIAGVLTGSTWEEQLRKRVLEPLGMKDTTIGTADIESVADRSLAYDDKDGEPVVLPYRSMANMTPAGGLFSSALDVTRYLLCQLNGGEVDGTRVISAAALKETHTLHMPLGNFPIPEGLPVRPYGYALGWMLGSFRGHHVVSHGGGIDGFTTEFMLLPDDGIGIAVCNNRASALPNALTYQIADRLLGVDDRDWVDLVAGESEKMLAAFREQQAPKKVVSGKPPAHDLAEYAGKFEHPGYGTLDVKVAGESLDVSLGVIRFDTEHRHFETWNLVFPDLGQLKFELTFLTDGSGDVAAATVNFEDTLPKPIRFERAADESAKDESVLNGLAGKYTLGPVTVEVKVEAGPKLVAYQNGMRVDLEPAGKLKYKVPAAPGLTLEFVVGEDGRATAIATPQGTLSRAD